VEPTNRPDEEDHSQPSKSQVKREMQALQDLGAQLVALNKERLAKIALPEDLRTAVRDAQRFTKHEARRRQLQYIGRLMRDVDPAPIQAALDAINGVSAAANARQHALERLRAELIENESVLGDIAQRHPGADLQHLRQLRRNALKEQAENKPPRAFRELFRVLRELQDQATESTEEDRNDPNDSGTADD
jgi:ribosome-associated protein